MILGSPPEKILWTAAAGVPICVPLLRAMGWRRHRMRTMTLRAEKQGFIPILNLSGQRTSPADAPMYRCPDCVAPASFEDQDRRGNHRGPQAAFVSNGSLRDVSGADDFVRDAVD